MGVRCSLTTASLIGAMSACAVPAGEGDPWEETPTKDEPLDVTVDSLDVVHGALRVSATMVDGAADVSVRLGGDCEHREVGGGLSTLSTLVWAIGDNDVAEAIGCGLRVRARVRDGARHVNKVAELAVTIDVAAQDPENPEDGPQLQTVTTSETGVSVVFAPVTRSARLTTGDSILETAPESEEETDAAAGDDTGRFHNSEPRLCAVGSERPPALSGRLVVRDVVVRGRHVAPRRAAGLGRVAGGFR